MAIVTIDPEFIAKHFFGDLVRVETVGLVPNFQGGLCIALEISGPDVPDAKSVSATFENFETIGGGRASRFAGFQVND